jgi:hypothetical protein
MAQTGSAISAQADRQERQRIMSIGWMLERQQTRGLSGHCESVWMGDGEKLAEFCRTRKLSDDCLRRKC